MAEKRKEHNWVKDIGAFFLLVLAVFAAVSVFGYSPDDPSFFTTGKTGPPENYAGKVGAYLAGFIFYASGYLSYAVPFLLGLFAVLILLRREFRRWLLRSLLYAGLFFSLSALFSRFIPVSEKMKKTGIRGGGGYIGDFIYNKLSSPYLGDTGGLVILFFLFLFFLILCFRISLTSIFEQAIHFVRIFYEYSMRYLKGIYLWIREKLRERRARAERAQERKREAQRKEEIAKGLKVIEPEFVREIESVKKRPRGKKSEQMFLVEQRGDYDLPPLSLLEIDERKKYKKDTQSTELGIQILERKLKDFGVDGKVTGFNSGPVITMYEFEPAPGIKINQIVNLSDDLALALRAQSVRILAPIPGKSAVGIEIPKVHRDTVFLKEVISSREFRENSEGIPVALGIDVMGNPVVSDLSKMPHLLIAGATGSGKSVCLHSIINSILYKNTPEDVKLILIDPKMLELSIYDGLPHLMHEVVVDIKDAVRVLKWAVRCMEARYETLKVSGAKNIEHYRRVCNEEMPSIIIAIDELADLMMIVGKDVEDSIGRLTQKARAAGIHLIVATQRPSVDIITGTIKANLPARIALKVPSKTDSRTILDANGAEALLGMGDMLFMPPNAPNLLRVHGAFISEAEVKSVVEFWSGQAEPEYDSSILRMEEIGLESIEGEDIDDDMYDDAVQIVKESQYASISYIQRRLRIGYNRAARLMERMEREGIIRRVGNNKWELAPGADSSEQKS